jgi:hypothetical protein
VWIFTKTSPRPGSGMALEVSLGLEIPFREDSHCRLGRDFDI